MRRRMEGILEGARYLLSHLAVRRHNQGDRSAACGRDTRIFKNKQNSECQKYAARVIVCKVCRARSRCAGIQRCRLDGQSARCRERQCEGRRRGAPPAPAGRVRR
jgi:hypothetical protein